VKLYFSIVREFRSSLCKKISKNSGYFVSVLDLIQGVVPAYVVFNDFIGKNNLPKLGLFKEWMEPSLQKVLDISYMALLQGNIKATLKEIKECKMTELMKSQNILKSYYQ